MDIRSFDLEFTRSARPHDEAQVQRILHSVTDLTDLIVMCHGWENEKPEADRLYSEFMRSTLRVLESKSVDGLDGRKFGTVSVYWPSKRFTGEELAVGPVPDAQGVTQTDETLLMHLLERLKDVPERLADPVRSETENAARDRAPLRTAQLEQAQRLVPMLETDPEARSKFVFCIRAILDPAEAHVDDCSAAFFEWEAESLFTNLGAPVYAPTPSETSGDTPGELSVVDGSGGAVAAARRIASYATYYDLKQRAALIGRNGLAQVLLRCRDRNRTLRLHLVGHSFGARLVMTAANALPPRTPDVTLSLLQAAFSHHGCAVKFDGEHDGAFRSVLAERRVSGPIIITHTKNDGAVGIAYPLASRLLAEEEERLAPDQSDPYWGMGRNGAQHTPEASYCESMLEYSFETGKVYNLKADEFIASHGDVTGSQTAYAVLQAIRAIGAPAMPETQFGDRFARISVPRELNNEDKRRKWGLPPLADTKARGQYIVELNASHSGGLPAAAVQFLKLCHQYAPEVMKRQPDHGGSAAVNEPEVELNPVRIAKSYYRCLFTEDEWRALIREDEKKAPKQRAIYRLWPDFPVSAHTDRSIATIKADAALRSFAAGGADIIWAVIDSGIQADHPHFGKPVVFDQAAIAAMTEERKAENDRNRATHALYADEVRDLHRCFSNVFENRNGILFDRGPLPSPDAEPMGGHELDENTAQVKAREHDALVGKHRDHALRDDFGHGSHVAGIIAGEAPSDRSQVCALERQYKMDADGNKISQTFEKRDVTVGRSGANDGDVQSQPLRGVAPRCKLVSLRVLDHTGRGRASQVIQALEYIRDSLNDNPKLLRVHGVNLSVGYEFDAELFACGQSPLCTQVDRLVQEGVVVVAAAGNTGYGSIAASVGTSKVGLSNTINDPGNAALAITVGATHRDMPHLYGVSYFSSKGPTGDGRLKPDLVAPGERITSCAAGTKLRDALRLNGHAPGIAYYVDDSGTSMAAPHVSGAIAAFLSIRREFIGRPNDVKRIFTESATPLGRERYFEGHGLVDLMRAIQSV